MKEFKIRNYIILDPNGGFWILDYSNLDVTEDELSRCIYEQIYGGDKNLKEVQNEF